MASPDQLSSLAERMVHGDGMGSDTYAERSGQPLMHESGSSPFSTCAPGGHNAERQGGPVTGPDGSTLIAAGDVGLPHTFIDQGSMRLVHCDSQSGKRVSRSMVDILSRAHGLEYKA